MTPMSEKLPEGMAAVNEHAEMLINGVLERGPATVRAIVAARDAAWRKALDEARAQIKLYEDQEIGVAGKCCHESTVALAASQAHVLELREALGHYDAREYHSEKDSDGQIQFVAEQALSRPSGDTDALREIVKRAVDEGFIGGRSSTAVCGGRQTLNEKAAIVARVLGEVAK